MEEPAGDGKKSRRQRVATTEHNTKSSRKVTRSGEDIETVPESLRELGRSLLGVADTTSMAAPFQNSRERTAPGVYPLVALCLLVLPEGCQTIGYFLLAMSISGSLGVGIGRGPGTFGFLTEIQAVAALIGVVATVAALARVRRPIRGEAAVLTGLLWATILGLGGIAIVYRWVLLGAVAGSGLMAGAAQALHRPLILESYPPECRVRAFSLYSAAAAMSGTCAALSVALFSGVLGLSWRPIAVVFGLACLLAAVGASRLRDPGIGVWDLSKMQEVIRFSSGGSGSGTAHGELSEEEMSVGLFEQFRQVVIIRSVRSLLLLFALFGFFIVPVQRYLWYFFAERWSVSATGRDVLIALLLFCALPSLACLSRYGDRAFRNDPVRLIRIVSTAAAVGMVMTFVAVIFPIFVGMVVILAVAYSCLYSILPVASVALLAVVHSARRTHSSALAGASMTLGVLIGASTLTSFDTRYGLRVAVFVGALLGAGLALTVRRRTATLLGDVDSLVEEVVEDQRLRAMVATGRHFPLLSCRRIDFAYGQVQVLFDVHLTLDDGEIAALLGTNGAGKSTLLRVISGVGMPLSGTIHYRGADITFISPSRRVQLGISQIPGGRAVFGPMSVIDNLRVYGSSLGHSRAALDRGIDATFEAFPLLAARRNQLASALSGGEQQMLALGKAFVLRPRLLLVDELSLGLAPRVIAELLAMVERINAAGTAVLLVEQSVNIALSLVDHAYFMEKGEMRFDGPANELVKRPDLLRAVFLEGASKGLT